MLRKTPKPFNAVDMVLALVRKGLGVIQAMVLTPAFEGVVASEGVGVIDRALAGVLSDVSHEFIRRDPLHDLGVNPAVSFQQAQHHALTLSLPAPLAFAPTSEVGVVNFNLAFKFAPFQLCHVVNGFSQALVDAGNGLIMQTQIRSQAIRRLLLVEAGHDGNLPAQLPQGLLSLARTALHVATFGFVNFKRTTENALSTSQKVGRTLENILFASNHMGILTIDSYEYH